VVVPSLFVSMCAVENGWWGSCVNFVKCVKDGAITKYWTHRKHTRVKRQHRIGQPYIKNMTQIRNNIKHNEVHRSRTERKTPQFIKNYIKIPVSKRNGIEHLKHVASIDGSLEKSCKVMFYM
jgi:hypothetical protein